MTIFKYMRKLICLAAFIAIMPMKSAYAENGNIHVTAELSNPYLNLTSTHPQTVYLKVALKGDPLVNGEKRPPMNIALVLDKSGSMTLFQPGDLQTVYLLEQAKDRTWSYYNLSGIRGSGFATGQGSEKSYMVLPSALKVRLGEAADGTVYFVASLPSGVTTRMFPALYSPT